MKFFRAANPFNGHLLLCEMNKITIPWAEVPPLAKTDIAYATGDANLRPFYTYPPDYQSFREIIDAKSGQYYPRELLADVLLEQYSKLGSNHPAIEKLRAKNTFTIVTAHQPTLFLQPLYVILKAFTAINLAEKLAELYPEIQFVPVFVLGSEDHDLEELNNARVFGKKLVWLPEETGGSVGLMNSSSLVNVLSELKAILGESENAKFIYGLIEKAYSDNRAYAESTQFLLDKLLGKYGLVVINMDDARLKKLFVPIMKKELLEQVSYNVVGKTIGELNKLGFKAQAPPREINLFYRTKNRRDRIVFNKEKFEVLNTSKVFTENELIRELEDSPEKFSPNVVLRPLFQELVLPNLAYIGGGGELSYWLERREQFAHFDIQFPMLVRRASLLWLDADAQKKIEKFGFSVPEFFQETEVLSKKFVEKHLAVEVGLGEEMEAMRLIFNKLAVKAKAIDPTLEAAVGAESTKQVAALEQWESRLRRAEKQKHETSLNQIKTLKEKLFPGGGLQERSEGFLPFYVKYGPAFFDEIKAAVVPFEAGFCVVV